MIALVAVYNHDLSEDIEKETSGILQRVLLSVSTGARDQTKADDVDDELAQMDARELYDVRVSQFASSHKRVPASRSRLHFPGPVPDRATFSVRF